MDQQEDEDYAAELEMVAGSDDGGVGGGGGGLIGVGMLDPLTDIMTSRCAMEDEMLQQQQASSMGQATQGILLGDSHENNHDGPFARGVSRQLLFGVSETGLPPAEVGMGGDDDDDVLSKFVVPPTRDESSTWVHQPNDINNAQGAMMTQSKTTTMFVPTATNTTRSLPPAGLQHDTATSVRTAFSKTVLPAASITSTAADGGGGVGSSVDGIVGGSSTTRGEEEDISLNNNYIHSGGVAGDEDAISAIVRGPHQKKPHGDHSKHLKYSDHHQSHLSEFAGIHDLPPITMTEDDDAPNNHTTNNSLMLMSDTGICRWLSVDPFCDDAEEEGTEKKKKKEEGTKPVEGSVGHHYEGRSSLQFLLGDTTGGGGGTQYGAPSSTTLSSFSLVLEEAQKLVQTKEELMAANQKESNLDEEIEGRGRSKGGKAEQLLQQEQQQQQESATQLWVNKYSPRMFRDLLSDESINLQVLQWIKSWDPYVFGSKGTAATPSSSTSQATQRNKRETQPPAPSSQKKVTTDGGGSAKLGSGGSPSGLLRPADRILLVVGPPGVGKTTLAHVVARHCGYEPVEINASVDRTTSTLVHQMKGAVANSEVVVKTGAALSRGGGGDAAAGTKNKRSGAAHEKLMRAKCLIMDEIDGITSNVIDQLLKIDVHRPVICLANSAYVPALRELRNRCQHHHHHQQQHQIAFSGASGSGGVNMITVPAVPQQRLLSRLEEICYREDLHLSKPSLSTLTHLGNGDIRSCLNLLQYVSQELRMAHEATKLGEEHGRRREATGGGDHGVRTSSLSQQRHNKKGKLKPLSADETLEAILMRNDNGKDSTIGLWKLWADLFTRKARAKYVQLLKTHFQTRFGSGMDEADEMDHHDADDDGGAKGLSAEMEDFSRYRQQQHRGGGGGSANAALLQRKFHQKRGTVDPGFIVFSKQLEQCGAEMDTFLDGAFQFYSRQNYTDYDLKKTARVAAEFSWNDISATHAFQNQAFGMQETAQKLTSLQVFASCSSTNNRGAVQITYPRELFNHKQKLKASHDVLTRFIVGTASSSPATIHDDEQCPKGLYGNISSTNVKKHHQQHAVQLLTTGTAAVTMPLRSDGIGGVMMETIPMLCRSLISPLVRLPPSFSLSVLPPKEKQLFLESAARHTAYGLSYIPKKGGDGGRQWQQRKWGTQQNANGAFPTGSGGGGGGGGGDEGMNSRINWTLDPPILDLMAPFKSPSRNLAGASSGLPGTNSGMMIKPSSRHQSSSSSSSVPPAPINKVMARDDVKEALIGEIHTERIRRRAAALTLVQKAAKEKKDRRKRGRNADEYEIEEAVGEDKEYTQGAGRAGDVGLSFGTKMKRAREEEDQGIGKSTTFSTPHKAKGRSSTSTDAALPSTAPPQNLKEPAAASGSAATAGRAPTTPSGVKQQAKKPKRDFFGRVITEEEDAQAKKKKNAAANKVLGTGSGSAAVNSQNLRGSGTGSSSTTHRRSTSKVFLVKYVHFDGATNSVKRLATIGDFI